MTGVEYFITLPKSIIQFPFFFVFKIVVNILNLIPLNVYELQAPATALSNPNDKSVGEYKIAVKGRRRLHLGVFIIAWTKGAVIKKALDSDSKNFAYGVWTEDYEKIIEKWTY